MAGRASLVGVGLLALAACGNGRGDFQFSVSVNDQSNGAVALLIDGEVVELAAMVQLDARVFESYEDALAAPVHMETHGDGAIIASCDLYAGACRGVCVPQVETASVCIDPDGRIGLNTWDCPCADEIADWFCGGDCALTAP